MNIAFISDLHISLSEKNIYNNIDVKGNFEKVLKSLKQEKIGLIVILGDICYRDGEREVYKWVRKKLEKTGIKYIVIPGNHDEPQKMIKEFEFKTKLKENRLYWEEKINNYRVLILDSHKYDIDKKQLKWLEKKLKKSDRKLMIFMHHPPLNSEVYYMDKNYPLKNMKKVQELLFNYPKEISIFCGHYHVAKIVKQKNVNLFICPSTFFEIDEKSKEFRVLAHKIVWRKLSMKKEILLTEIKECK